MTNFPPPPPPNRPALAVPESMPSSCHCEHADPGLVRLRALMAGGMGQWEASRKVWPPPEPPVPVAPPVVLPEAITPRPARRSDRHARLLNRWINREVS